MRPAPAVPRAFLPRTLVCSAAVLAIGAFPGCDTPPLDRNAAGGYPNHDAPSGRIEGTLVYEGPPPAVDRASGRPLGRVVLLLFRQETLPPPQGLATTAVSVQTLPASQMFSGASPLASGAVRASTSFVFPGINQAGIYQLRAFYSHKESTDPSPTTGMSYPTGFHPLFSVRNQPVQDDVGGGAVDLNAPGRPFLPIAVGSPTPSDGGGVRYVIPAEGAVTRGVTVFLGTSIVTDRPVFRLPTSATPTPATALVRFTEVHPTTPDAIRALGFLAPTTHVLELPANVAVDDNPMAPTLTVPSFPLQAGLDSDTERESARTAGVEVAQRGPTGIPLPQPGRAFLETAYDFNGNGVIDWSLTDPLANADAHPTLVTGRTPSRRFPWIFPLVVLTRMHEPTPAEAAVLANPAADPTATARVLAAINAAEPGYLDTTDPARPSPVFPVVIFGSVVPGGDPAAGLLMHTPAWNVPGAINVEDTLRVVVPPVAFEVHGPDPATDWVAILPPLGPSLLMSVGAVLGTPRPPVAHYRCDPMGLPQGRYAVNLITQYGQAWTTPNELTPLAIPSPNPAVPSQGLIVRIRAPDPTVTGTLCPTPATH